ncbi:MAG: C40 family peptidase [Rectinemataceae bacterium]|nr:C40 family peptidase [Rectinemataceae bacterium]
MRGRPMGRIRIKPSAALLSLGLFLGMGNLQAQEIQNSQNIQDISQLLPPVRGLGFDELRADVNDRGILVADPRAVERISLIANALSWLGTPYLYGGRSRSGADCSGFLGSILASALTGSGPFPRKTDEYASFGIGTAAIEPGDILLFALDGDIYHVGLALSADTFIHAASEGSRTGVIISSLHEGSWSKRLAGARRIQ